MSLDFLTPGERPGFGFDPSSVYGSARAEDAPIRWLTMVEPASRAFARLTASMRGLPGPDQDPSVWLRQGVAALERADPSLVLSLRRAAAEACPVMVLRGLPVEPIPPVTPYQGVVDQAASHQAIVNLHAVVGCLGLHPVSYAQENVSTLHAVCPVRGARGQVSSRGFDAFLPFHTDYADRPVDEPAAEQSPAAAALAFAVERAEPAIPMECVPASRLRAALSPEQIRIGRSEAFSVRAPDLFGGRSVRVRRLFFSDSEPGFRCRLNLGRMTGCDARAEHLLHEIREFLSDETLVEKLSMRRGDIVVMDNQRTIHRRAAFTPRWDGTDRYFIRMSTVRDPRAGIASDPTRPWIWS